MIRECIEVATQAPTGATTRAGTGVVVTDQEKRGRSAEWYRDGVHGDLPQPDAVLGRPPTRTTRLRDATTQKVIDSADYLADHMARCRCT